MVNLDLVLKVKKSKVKTGAIKHKALNRLSLFMKINFHCYDSGNGNNLFKCVFSTLSCYLHYVKYLSKCKRSEIGYTFADSSSIGQIFCYQAPHCLWSIRCTFKQKWWDMEKLRKMATTSHIHTSISDLWYDQASKSFSWHCISNNHPS